MTMTKEKVRARRQKLQSLPKKSFKSGETRIVEKKHRPAIRVSKRG